MKFGYNWLGSFRGNVDPAYSKSSPGVFDSGELKKGKGSHSRDDLETVGTRGPLYLGHSI